MKDRILKFFKKHRITPDQILYITREDGKTVIYLVDGSTVPTFIAMKAIYDVLPEGDFVLANKGVLLPYSQIVNVEGGVYLMSDGRRFAGRVKNKGEHKQAAKVAHSAAKVSSKDPCNNNGFLAKRYSNDLANMTMASCCVLMRIDLSDGSFVTLKNILGGPSTEEAESFDEWVDLLIFEKCIHPDDTKSFREHVSSKRLCTPATDSCKGSNGIYIRGRIGDEYKWGFLEATYSHRSEDGHDIAYIYIRDVEDSIAKHAAVANALSAENAYDALTGLRLNEAFLQAANDAVSSDPLGNYAILCAEIENFMLVKDYLGNETWSLLLKELVSYLSSSLPGYVTGCRTAEGSMCFLLKDASSDLLQNALSKVAEWEQKIGAQVSFGASKVDAETDIKECQRRASIALQKTKALRAIHMVEYENEFSETPPPNFAWQSAS